MNQTRQNLSFQFKNKFKIFNATVKSYATHVCIWIWLTVRVIDKRDPRGSHSFQTPKVFKQFSVFKRLYFSGDRISIGMYPLITYYWPVPLILDHSYLVGKLTSSKIADTKVAGF